MKKSIIKYQNSGKTLKLNIPKPYTSLQEADAALNQKGFDSRTGDRETHFQGTLSGPTISAKNTPVGYRSDQKSIKEDILNTSPKDWGKIPSKYDKYKLSTRISTGAPTMDPSTQGLINIAQGVANLPQYIAPIPFINPAIKGLHKYVGKPIYNTVKAFDEKLQYLVDPIPIVKTTERIITDPKEMANFIKTKQKTAFFALPDQERQALIQNSDQDLKEIEKIYEAWVGNPKEFRKFDKLQNEIQRLESKKPVFKSRWDELGKRLTRRDILEATPNVNPKQIKYLNDEMQLIHDNQNKYGSVYQVDPKRIITSNDPRIKQFTDNQKQFQKKLNDRISFLKYQQNRLPIYNSDFLSSLQKIHSEAGIPDFQYSTSQSRPTNKNLMYQDYLALDPQDQRDLVGAKGIHDAHKNKNYIKLYELNAGIKDLHTQVIEPMTFYKPRTWSAKNRKILSYQHTYTPFIEELPQSTQSINQTQSHELGHSVQDIANWSRLLSQADDKYNYYTSHGNNPLSKRFQMQLKKPQIDPTNPNRHTYQTWLSDPQELHADLFAERIRDIRDLMKRKSLNPERAVKLYRDNLDAYVQKTLESGKLYRFFDSPTDQSNLIERKELLKLLPMGAGVAVGGKQIINKKQQ